MTKSVYPRQNDTLPYMDYTLIKDNSGTPHNLSGATVTFTMRNRQTDALKINKAAVTIIDAGAGRVRYAWIVGDLDTVGNYNAEFEVVFSSGRILTFPEGEYIPIEVIEELE